MPTLFSNVETLPQLNDMEVFHTKLTGHRFPMHFHDSFVVQLIIHGADSCSVSGLTAYEGDIFVHCPKATHTGGTLGANSLEYKAIYPSPALVADLLNTEALDSTWTSSSFIIRSGALATDMKEMFRSIEQNDLPNSSRDHVGSVMRRVCAQADPSESVNNDFQQRPISEDIQQIRDHLVANSKRDVSISELADVSGLSQFHLIREFKRAFGITPRQFLISVRVSEAKNLLSRGMPIAIVALQLGFSDQSHLNRCFKRVSGFNPGQFVRKR